MFVALLGATGHFGPPADLGAVVAGDDAEALAAAVAAAVRTLVGPGAYRCVRGAVAVPPDAAVFLYAGDRRFYVLITAERVGAVRSARTTDAVGALAAGLPPRLSGLGAGGIWERAWWNW